MDTVSFFIIQVDSPKPKTADIVHFRYLSRSCPQAFDAMTTSGTEDNFTYKILLLFVADGRHMDKCIVMGRKFVTSKIELANCLSGLLLFSQTVPTKQTSNYQA